MHDEEIVQRARTLMEAGLTVREVAQTCGISTAAVRKWRYGTRRRTPDPSAPGRHDGRIKRDCPRCFARSLDRQSYAYLLGLYLGDGHIVATSKGCYRLTITCCATWPGLIDATEQSMARAMPQSKVNRRSVTGAIDVNSQSKHWPCLFPQHGPGRKHTRKIELAVWQQEIVDQCTEEFVRGLIHSDGCRTTNRVRKRLKDGDRWYEYPRYNFTNVSVDIQRLFTDALDRLGVAWTQMNAKNISVARRGAVARLDEFVGPKY